MLKEKANLMKCLILILSLIMILFALTGCGASSEIVDTLNNVVNEEFAEWQEQGYARSFTMYLIQDELSKVKPEYIIVASGDTAFTTAPGITEYEEGEVPNYSSTGYSYTRMMEGDSAATNLVILDTSTGKYYNVEISYQEAELRGVMKNYPVFSNAEEIK